MKKVILFLFVVSLVAVSCKKTVQRSESIGNLITPELYVTQSSSPYSGLLSVYPCHPRSSVYYGNYIGQSVTELNPAYYVEQGVIIRASRPIRLPIGTYNLVYWGESNPLPGAYTQIAVKGPVLFKGVDLAEAYYALRKHAHATDTAYLPTYDYVYGLREVTLGSDLIGIEMNRVVAGLTVSVQQPDGAALDASISGINVLIGGVAARLNAYTAVPDDFTKTVRFALTISPDRTVATNARIMVFPTIANPPLTIIINLINGKQLLYKTQLTTALLANTNLNLDIDLGPLIVEETTGNGFQVARWNEKSEIISTGPVD